jgi:SpoVK/Ycf46/Vps4 family AAA+-type ATPase
MPIPPAAEKTFPVAVTNASDAELVGYFDSQKYVFPKGKTVTVENNVARHILGYDMDEKAKEQVVVMHGWCRKSDDLPRALSRLKRFRFEPDEETHRSTSPAAARVPLNSPKGEEGGKLLVA